MMFNSKIARRLFLAALPTLVWVVVGAASSTLWAQFEDVAEEKAAANNRRQQGHFEVSEENFDQWIYGGRGQQKQHRARIDSMVSLQIEKVDQVCGLSPKQKELLKLAAQGDITRFEDRVEVVREKFKLARFDQQKFNKIWQEIQPLRNKLQNGLFDESSLLQKVVQGVLDPEQIAKYEQADLERRRFAYEAKIGLFLAQIQNGIPMRDEQREKFTKLLLEETAVPKKYGQYAHYVVMVNASQISEEKMKEIFDDAQWRAMKQTFVQARGMERHLKQQGVLP